MIWQTKKLGDLLELCDAGTWGEENPKGFPLLRSTNMQNGHLILDDLKIIDVSKYKKEYYTLLKGDILMTKSSGSVDHIGKSLFITSEMDGKYGFSNFTQRLRPDKTKVLPEWIYYKVSDPATRDFLLGASQTTTGLRNLKISELKELEIPLPSLKIQKEIVAKLDEKFERLNKAKKIREESISDTEKILSQTLQEIFEDGKKKGWEEKTLREICLKTETINPKKDFKSEFSYIDITSVSSMFGAIPRARILPISKAPSRARKLVIEGDTIFATTRPYLKNIAYIPNGLSGSVASTGFCIIRPNLLEIDPKFLFNLISSDYFVEKVIPFQKGATYPAVSDSVIYQQTIWAPSLPEQQKIVARLDTLSGKIRKLKEIQKSQLEDFKKLEKSYLREAFNGEL